MWPQIQDAGTLIAGVTGVVATTFTAWYQTRKAHQTQVAVLAATQEREDRMREEQFAEADKADRLLVLEYVDQLLPRLCQITSIYFLAGGTINKDQQERELFERLKSYMMTLTVDPAHPEKNLALRLAFLFFQLIAALRAALNARWTRPLSKEQTQFLAEYEAHLEPILCSGRYPGDELLYREQIEIIADEMLVPKQGVVRPLNWKEFCSRYDEGGVLCTLAELVAHKLRFVFDDANPRSTAPRRAMQCRLAILALYLIDMSERAGSTGWSWRSDTIWEVVTNWYRWEEEQRQEPEWYVFSRGDVRRRIEKDRPVPV